MPKLLRGAIVAPPVAIGATLLLLLLLLLLLFFIFKQYLHFIAAALFRCVFYLSPHSFWRHHFCWQLSSIVNARMKRGENKQSRKTGGFFVTLLGARLPFLNT